MTELRYLKNAKLRGGHRSLSSWPLLRIYQIRNKSNPHTICQNKTYGFPLEWRAIKL